MEPLTPIKPEYWIIKKEYWKISKEYWEISAAYRLKVVCLSLKDCVLIAQGLRAYRSWAVCLLLVTCLLIDWKEWAQRPKGIALIHTLYQSWIDYSSTAAWAAANGSWLSALYGKFGKHLGNIWETLWACTAHSAPHFLKISVHFCHFGYLFRYFSC